MPVTEETRRAFHADLDVIDSHVHELFTLVEEGLAGATAALLSGDREAARALQARDAIVDALYRDIEVLVPSQFALQAPVAVDMRFLLAVLRIVPELERSADLAEHIAQRAARGLTEALTPRILGLVERMGAVGSAMWGQAAKGWTARDDAELGVRLDAADDELDELRTSLTAAVASGEVSLPVAMEMALVGRFYERLGDHAVNVARRISYVVTGGLWPSPEAPRR
jgi:phosphate transport system protein